MQFVDINLGWTNYLQLVDKRVPEFRKNLIILDGDVQAKKEYKSKKSIIDSAKNILFLPLVIEKDLFILLKDHACFNEFKGSYCNVSNYNYDICFNNWSLEPEKYETNNYKKWFKDLLDTLGGSDGIFDFWIYKNTEKYESFCNAFLEAFNQLADSNEIDGIPINTEEQE